MDKTLLKLEELENLREKWKQGYFTHKQFEMWIKNSQKKR